jgi:acyl carrier protein
MVPSGMKELAAMPLTPNGKLDRKQLPRWEADASESPFIPPLNEVELFLAKIWRDVLQVEKIGLNSNFFDMGGHSLLLLRVHRSIEEELQRQIPIVEMFRYPTLQAFAQFLSGNQHDSKEQARTLAENRKGSRQIIQQQFAQRLQSRKKEN